MRATLIVRPVGVSPWWRGRGPGQTRRWGCGMWKSIGALLTRAGEALGIEVPELPGVGAVGDTATGAVDTVRGQAGEAVAGISQTLSGTVGNVAVTGSSVG